MKIAISSVAGHPLDPRTWSAAPANLAAALQQKSHEVVAIDSSLLSNAGKLLHVPGAVLDGLPWNAISWASRARKLRGAFVDRSARASGASHILCTGTLDAPVGSTIPYSIWIDNTWQLLSSGRTAPVWAHGKAFAVIDELERKALSNAQTVLTFSEHVRRNLLQHYGLSEGRVFVVGCGSGELPPYEGTKDYQAGHLLFVAKHLFVPKGGEIVLKTFEIVRRHRPQTKLVVVGSAEVAARLQGVPGVTAYGFVSREQLSELFYQATALLQPMLADPWGQVYLEAMKARALVISLNVAALPELTDDGRLGLLVESPDPEQLAAAVLSVYERSNPEINALTAEAQGRVVNNFSWDAVASRVMAALTPINISPRVPTLVYK